MILDYSAACGLLGGLRKNSLKDEDLELLKGKGESSFRGLLKDYLSDNYPSNGGISSLERAVYVSHIKRTVKLLRFLNKEARETLRMFLSEFDIFNLKLLIRRIELRTESGSEMFYWKFPYLAFKDRDPSDFKNIEDLKLYLKNKPVINKILHQALNDLKFYKDIFYFDICLDREYLTLLKNISLELDKNSSRLVHYFISIKLLTYVLRLKFFQGRSAEEIRSALSDTLLSDRSIYRQVLNAPSLEGALDIIEKSPDFIKFKAGVSLNFEEDLENIFYNRFLKKRGTNFFSFYPYLAFYLKQRYLIEKLVFLINNNLG